MYWLRNISPFLGLLVLLHCASVITPAHAHSGHPHADAARIHRMLANDARGAITAIAHVGRQRRKNIRALTLNISKALCILETDISLVDAMVANSLCDGCCQDSNCSHCSGACSHVKGCAASCVYAHGGVITSAFSLGAPQREFDFFVCQQRAVGRDLPPEPKPPQT